VESNGAGSSEGLSFGSVLLKIRDSVVTPIGQSEANGRHRLPVARSETNAEKLFTFQTARSNGNRWSFGAGKVHIYIQKFPD
jgi:hypothetical protein